MILRIIVGVILVELLFLLLGFMGAEGEPDDAFEIFGFLNAIVGTILGIYLFLITSAWVFTGEWNWAMSQ